jgi:hypothetical protein
LDALSIQSRDNQWLGVLNSVLFREYRLGRTGTSGALGKNVRTAAFGNLVVGKKSSINTGLYRVGDIYELLFHLDQTHP